MPRNRSIRFVTYLGLLSLELAAPQISADSSHLLQVVGQGTARYLFMDIYDAQLLAPETADAESILEQRSPFCLRLTYDVDMKRQYFITAAKKILDRQWGENYVQQTLAPELQQFHAAYRDVKGGDVYEMCYATDGQVSLSLNGKDLVNLNSPAFAQAYFGIWLSKNKPISEKLRSQLLGES